LIKYMLLISGSLAYDQILDFPGKFADSIMPDKLHMLNVSFLVHKMRKGFGGTAGNIAYTLSLLGVRPALIGTVGDDFVPYREFLEKHKIETSNVKTIKGQYCSTAIGFTDSKDNQIWGFHIGADAFSDKISVKKIKNKIDFGLIAPHNPKTMLNFAREYTSLKIPYLFDPGMQLPYFSGEDLKMAFKGAKIIIGNDYEIAIMQKKTGISDLHTLAKKEKIVITTLGEKGSFVSEAKGSIKIKPAKPKSVTDPAGAGDAYRAGFLAGYLKGLSIETCARMGSVISVYTVEKYGTTTHSFTIPEFCARFKANYGEEIQL
jgi:adenosine kinase